MIMDCNCKNAWDRGWQKCAKRGEYMQVGTNPI